jgi:hypothetical protein
MTDPEPAEASFDRESRTELSVGRRRLGTSPRRRAARRRDRLSLAVVSQPDLRLVGADTVPAVRGNPAEAATSGSGAALAAVACSICQVEFDAFSSIPEAAFFAFVHNGLHHGSHPVAAASAAP